MRKIFVVLLLLLTGVTFNCGGKEKVKPSADSLLAQEALDKIEVIRNAYQKKDFETLQNQIDVKLAEGILKALNFENAELLFTSRMIKITDASVTVNLNWHGTWKTYQGNINENRGLTELVLQRSNWKLIQVNGDNPFIAPIEK